MYSLLFVGCCRLVVGSRCWFSIVVVVVFVVVVVMVIMVVVV